MKLSDKVAISADVVAREVSGELVLLNLDSGTYFGLNPVGGRVWALVEEQPRTLQEVSAVLQEEFAVSAEEAESDLLQLAADLHQHGLLLLAA